MLNLRLTPMPGAGMGAGSFCPTARQINQEERSAKLWVAF